MRKCVIIILLKSKVIIFMGEMAMLERVQGRSVLGTLSADAGIHLHGAQKALADWAIVDDFNDILDLHCQDTQLLRYLSQKFSLRACGIADSSEHARQLREEAPDAEIFCARINDIPWRSEAFDTVFYQLKKNDAEADLSFLQEAARVLKPGGQMIIAIEGLPEALCAPLSALGIMEQEERITPRKVLTSMENAGLSDVSYRFAQPFVGVAIGWKRD